jgi:2-polyprenyl-3-methyl-5-hydroxy-6-metoxy-1,4-benzoquinol methylase
MFVIKSGIVRLGSEHNEKAASQYDATYANFQTSLYEEIRREAFGEDIGQNSWLTADEHDKFLGWLGLAAGKSLLDVACGTGGPALRTASLTGCAVTGVDVHEQAISTARSLASERGLENRADFRTVHADKELPFPDAQFDAIVCIDAINHLPERAQILGDWTRLLKPGARLLFTDPIVVTGPLTQKEIAIRSSSGFYLFVPLGYDEQLIAECGLRLIISEDRSRNIAEIAERRKNARASRCSDLRRIEGDEVYENQQKFLSVAALLARDARLSRFVYLAEKA